MSGYTPISKMLKQNKEMNYILFGSDEIYYAQGGGHDFIRSSEDFQELVAEGKRRKRKRKGEGFEEYFKDCLEWWHVMEASSGRIIYGSSEQACEASNLHIGTKIKDEDY